MTILYTTQTEETIKNELERALERSGFSEVFRNRGVNVCLVHPFEYLFRKDGKSPTSLFPCVVVSCDEDIQAYPDITVRNECAAGSRLLEELEEDRKKPFDLRNYFLSDEARKQMKEHLSGPVLGEMYKKQKRESVTLEIWADNPLLKNRIYDIVDTFLFGDGRYLLQEKNIEVMDESVTGRRNGLYNFDFGKSLYGSTITFEAITPRVQFVFHPEDKERIKEIDVSLNGEKR